MNRVGKLLAVIAVSGSVWTAFGQETPPEGFVPNEKTAVRIAEAVLAPIFGDKKIQAEKPFRAQLRDGHWEVRGTLPQGKGHEVVYGGVAVVQIDKKDGRIILAYHEK